MELPINYEKANWRVRKKAREAYVELQSGKCAHCKELLVKSPRNDVQRAYINKALFPKSMFMYPVHLHHDRKSGLSIGAIHARCNAWLWQYKGE